MLKLMCAALVLGCFGCGGAPPSYAPKEQARFDALGADLTDVRAKHRAASKKLAGLYDKITKTESRKGAKTTDVVVCGATVGAGGMGTLNIREKPNRKASFMSKGTKLFGGRSCNAYEVKVVR
jgi:hypothetical protein